MKRWQTWWMKLWQTLKVCQRESGLPKGNWFAKDNLLPKGFPSDKKKGANAPFFIITLQN